MGFYSGFSMKTNIFRKKKTSQKMQDFMYFFHFLIFGGWGSKKVGHEFFFSLGNFWGDFARS